ncbi:MAG: response regulator transcription factor [Spirochaetales bacterium]|jgi:two-component system response regulator RegX3|nr:response regulator transcription factor [Spirochaetales bacterium]
MQGKILIIEDVREMAELITLYLNREGMEVKSAESAEDALGLLKTWGPDLIILDLNLPGMDGYEFLQAFRRSRNTPVMIVSARNSDEDQISGLSSGADEYVTKPFSPRVLVARVRALLKRVALESEDKAPRLFRFGPFTLDPEACLLRRGEKKIPLSAKEYEVLAYLAENSGRPETPDRIYAAVWKNEFGDLTTVAVYIQRLRKKIEDSPSRPVYLETVHGMGYRLNLGVPDEN